MEINIKPKTEYFADITVPGDKSITHRAVMLNAAAEGKAVVTNALLGEDCLSTINCMRKLGARIAVCGNTVTVESDGTFKTPDGELYCGNSGTTMRLLAGLLAGAGVKAVLAGDASLSSRPMGRVIKPLSLMGADITAEGGKAPLKVSPAKLSGITYAPPESSAQVKSAVLLAGLNADSATVVDESEKTRDHTEIMLRAMGADIDVKGNTVTVKRSKLRSVNIDVPGDISSASFLLALPLMLGRGRVSVNGCGINPTRTGVLEAFKAARAHVGISDIKNGAETAAKITVESRGALSPFNVGGRMVPSLIDELPLLAALAAFADGVSIFSGAAELKVKESNRIDSTAAMLRALGAEVETRPDGFVVYGRGCIEGSGVVDSRGDHRIAMAAAVAGAASKKGCKILGADSVNISFPGFFGLLENGGG